MGCLSGIAKCMLFVFNILIVVCGIALIAVGTIILYKEHKGIESFTEFSVGGFAIAVGLIIFVIAFFGCCGAIKENSCMLTAYAIILIVLLILQIIFGILAFVVLKDNEKKVKKVVEKVFKGYFSHPSDEDLKKVVDDTQQSYACCGVDGPKDWARQKLVPPKSCYKDKKQNEKNLFKTGCAQAYRDSITYNIKIIGYVALGFAVVELVGACFAFMVRNKT